MKKLKIKSKVRPCPSRQPYRLLSFFSKKKKKTRQVFIFTDHHVTIQPHASCAMGIEFARGVITAELITLN